MNREAQDRWNLARLAVLAPGSAPAEMAKRTFDVCVASICLVLLLPLMACIGALVKMTSPGPVLYRQRRVGRFGREFSLLKFRTMRVGAGGPGVTAGGDERITGVGRILRGAKLDELPQLANVVRGDMSLVGPRPEVARYVRLYSEDQRRVLSVRPGVTGVSQLAFRHEESLLRGRGDVEEFYISTVLPAKLALDLRYVECHSFLGDLLILARTALVLLQRASTPGESAAGLPGATELRT